MNAIDKNTRTKKRIVVLDVIRGLAILGILMMNIQSFAMVGQAYLNPTAYGDLNGFNKWVWIGFHVIADHKFLSIFSMLFGASLIMITDSIEWTGASAFRSHYRRNFWLLIIGLFHAYLIWYGDILVPYAICAMVLYPFRKWAIRKLLLLGILLFSVASISDLISGLDLVHAPQELIQQVNRGWMPTQQQIDREVSAYTGTFLQQCDQRMTSAYRMQTTFFITHYFWRISGLMLIGMALFKSGFLKGDLPEGVYKKALVLGGLTGLALVIIGVAKNFQANWSVTYSMLLGSQFNYWGSLGMALAYIAAMVLICRKSCLPAFTTRLAAVGRMALTNYLLQSLICTTIFYTFGYFGQADRTQQLMLVLFIWCFQLYLSPVWMRHFRYGPAEWLWRSLTQGKMQKMGLVNN